MTKKDDRIRVRGVRRDKPDIARLGNALIQFAAAQAEKDAQEAHARRVDGDDKEKGEVSE